MLDKEKGMQWLRETGNEGLIITTVSALYTDSLSPRQRTLAGKSLPEDLFKVGSFSACFDPQKRSVER